VHEEALVHVPNSSWPVGALGFGDGSIDHPEREAPGADDVRVPAPPAPAALPARDANAAAVINPNSNSTTANRDPENSLRAEVTPTSRYRLLLGARLLQNIAPRRRLAVERREGANGRVERSWARSSSTVACSIPSVSLWLSVRPSSIRLTSSTTKPSTSSAEIVWALG
jgi:hypothetical protein